MNAKLNSTEQKEQNTAAENVESRLIATKGEAKSLGLHKYLTGKPCKRGHYAYRLASTGGCTECMKAVKKGAPSIKKPKGFWLVKENIEEESKKYKTKSEMKAKNNPAYIGMYTLKLSDELFPDGEKSNGYWTIERSIEAAKKYSGLDEFSKSKDAKAYQNLSKLGIVREHTTHMNHKKQPA